MPAKSMPDTHRWEQFHHSLRAKVYRSTIMGAVVLGSVALAVGLGLYTWSLIEQYIGESFGLARSTALVAQKIVAEDDGFTKDIMDVYRALTPEQRGETGTAAYRERFADVQSSGTYREMLELLTEFNHSSEVSDVYFSRFDRDTMAIVYLCDPEPNPKARYWPGEWESVTDGVLGKFMGWNGEGELYNISHAPKNGWMCTCGYPLRNSDGDIVGFIMTDTTMDEVWQGMRLFLATFIGSMVVLVNLFAWVMTRHMKQTLITPINEIAQAAQNYVADRRRGVTATDHFSRLNIHTRDEIENLSHVMGDMERDLTDYEASLTRATAERERISTELSLAAQIQADMLPGVFPPFPDHHEFDIYALMEPAREVGGDFYDFFLVDEDHLGLVIADVSGKGVPAALFMTISMTLIRNGVTAGLSPARALEAANEQLCANNRKDMFVTVWLGVIDLKAGVLTAVNAGHEYPVVREPGGRYELLKDRHGLMVGAMPGIRYREYQLELKPGARLFLYTDGVPEATDPAQQMFGLDRMLSALNEAGDAPPAALLPWMRRQVDAFVGAADQFDDITMLGIQYFGRQLEGETQA